MGVVNGGMARVVCASRQPLAGWPQYPGQGWTQGPPATYLDSLVAGVNPPFDIWLEGRSVVGPNDQGVKLGCSGPTLTWTPATAASDIGTACPTLLLAQGVPAAWKRLEPPARDRLWAHMPEQQKEGTEPSSRRGLTGPESKCFSSVGHQVCHSQPHGSAIVV